MQAHLEIWADIRKHRNQTYRYVHDMFVGDELDCKFKEPQQKWKYYTTLYKIKSTTEIPIFFFALLQMYISIFGWKVCSHFECVRFSKKQKNHKHNSVVSFSNLWNARGLFWC